MARVLALPLAVASLGGCVSVLPQPEAPQSFYQIGPVSALPEARLSESIVITEPSASAVMAGRDIAVESETGGLLVLRSVQWADRATRLYQAALLDSFVTDGGSLGGFAVSGDHGVRAPLELRWRLSDFVAGSGEARCGANVTVIESRSRRVVDQSAFRAAVETFSDEPADVAEAMARCSREMVGDIAIYVSELDTSSTAGS